MACQLAVLPENHARGTSEWRVVAAMMPSSIGIIPDGNRRWARKSGINNLFQAYHRGYTKLRSLLTVINDRYRFVDTVYVYVLSRDNCSKRSQWELSIIFSIMKQRILDDIWESEEQGVSTVIVGDFNHPALPANLRKALNQYHYDTYIENGGLPKGKKLVLGLCYDPIWEITAYNNGNPRPMPSLTLDEIDLVIRTGGEKRLSGFFPILARYAELYFTEKLWPEFTEEDLKDALKWFQHRRRPKGR